MWQGKSNLLAITLLLIGIAAIASLWKQHFSQEQRASQPARPAINLRMGHNLHPDDSLLNTAQQFADTVYQASRGKLAIQLEAKTNFSQAELMAATQAGDIDIILPDSQTLSAFIPQLEIFELPYLLQSEQHAEKVLQGEIGQRLLAESETPKIKCTSLWGNGFKQFTSNKPVHFFNDLSGLTIARHPMTNLNQLFIKLGSSIADLPMEQRYQALEADYIQAQESTITELYNHNLYQFQPHLLLTDHRYQFHGLCFSEASLTNLPPPLSSLLQAHSKRFSEQQSQRYQSKEHEAMQKLMLTSKTLYRLMPRQKLDVKNQAIELYQASEYQSLIQQIQQLAQDPSNTEAEHYELGLNADLSGGSAVAGQAIKRGLELAIAQLNEQGGILGKPVSLIALDHAGEVTKAIENLQTLSDMPRCLAIFGGLHSPLVLAQLPHIHRSNRLYMIPWAAAAAITLNAYQPNLVFRLSANDREASGFLIDAALQQHQKIALLLEDTSWGRGNFRSMEEALKQRGTAATSVQWFKWGEPSFSKQLKAIADSDADAIVFVGNAPETITMVRELADQKQPLPVISHWGLTGGGFWPNAQESLAKLDLRFLQTYSFINNSGNADIQQRFILQYLKRYGLEDARQIPAPTGSAHAYDLMLLLAQAIETAQSPAPHDIRVELERLETHRGLIKTYKRPFSTTDHDALSAEQFMLARYDEHGSIVPIAAASH